MTNLKGTPELIAAGVRRIAQEEVRGTTSIFEVHSEQDLNAVKDIGTGGNYVVAPVQTEGTGTASSGFVFSPSPDVFDPTEYFGVVERTVVNQGTPYYPRYVSVDKSNGTKLTWAAPVVDTAGRWLLTSVFDTATNTSVVSELIDSYLIMRETISRTDGAILERIVAGVVAHSAAAVSFLKGKFEVGGAVTSTTTKIATFAPQQFVSRSYGSTTILLEVRTQDTDEVANFFSFQETATLNPANDYVYYIHAVTKGQVDGLELRVDPNFEPVDVKASVTVIPGSAQVATGEVFAIAGFATGIGSTVITAGTERYVRFQLSAEAVLAGVTISEPVDDGASNATWAGVWAPPTTGVFTITAHSLLQPNVSAVSTIVVSASPTVSVQGYPFQSTIKPSETRTLYGMVYGSSNKNILWSINHSTTTSGSSSSSDFGTVSPAAPTAGTLGFSVVKAGVTTQLRSSTIFSPPASRPTFTDGNYIVATSVGGSTPGVWKERDQQPRVYVDPTTGNAGGDFWFPNDWGYSGEEVTITSTTADIELRVNVSGGLKELNIYPIVVKSDFVLDPNGAGGNLYSGSATAPTLNAATQAPYHLELTVPSSGSKTHTFIMTGMNITAANLFPCIRTSGSITYPGDNYNTGETVISDYYHAYVVDPNITISLTDSGVLPGGSSTVALHRYDVTITVSSACRTTADGVTTHPKYAEGRVLVYTATDTISGIKYLYMPVGGDMTLTTSAGSMSEIYLTNADKQIYEVNYTDTGSSYEYPTTLTVLGGNLDAAHVGEVFVYVPKKDSTGAFIGEHDTPISTLNYTLGTDKLTFSPTIAPMSDASPGLLIPNDLNTYIFEIRPKGSSLYPNKPAVYTGLFPHFLWRSTVTITDPNNGVGYVADSTPMTIAALYNNVWEHKSVTAAQYYLNTYPDYRYVVGSYFDWNAWTGDGTGTGIITTHQVAYARASTQKCVRITCGSTGSLVVSENTPIGVNTGTSFAWVSAKDIKVGNSVSMLGVELLVTAVTDSVTDNTLTSVSCIGFLGDGLLFSPMTLGVIAKGGAVPTSSGIFAPKSVSLATTEAGKSTIMPTITEYR